MNAVETKRISPVSVKSGIGLATESLTGTDFQFMPVEPEASEKYNSGFIARRNFLIVNKSIELCYKLHIDLLNSNRYLLNKVPVKIKMERAKNSFVLMGNAVEESKYFIHIEKCALYVRKVKLNPSVMADHLKSLQYRMLCTP